MMMRKAEKKTRTTYRKQRKRYHIKKRKYCTIWLQICHIIFLFGPHNIGAKALETKWMHLFGTTLKFLAEVLKKFKGHGVRSYANVVLSPIYIILSTLI